MRNASPTAAAPCGKASNGGHTRAPRRLAISSAVRKARPVAISPLRSVSATEAPSPGVANNAVQASVASAGSRLAASPAAVGSSTTAARMDFTR